MPSLLSVARVLTSGAKLTTAERAALKAAGPAASPAVVAAVVKAIRAGEDPLGAAYCRINTAFQRRSSGQTFTPDHVVSGMYGWARRQKRDIVRLVDPGAGTGRYTLAGLRALPGAKAVAVEMDPVVAVLLRANLAAAGVADRAQVVVSDYRSLKLPKVTGSTLFVGNPPYVRHHGISAAWKEWYSEALSSAGLKGSQLAGLHLHFFLKTQELARTGDLGVFVTAAEWLDVRYGSSLRDMLVGQLGGTDVFVVEPQLQVFDDAMVSAAITGFAPGSGPTSLRFKSVQNAKDLKSLPAGRAVAVETLKAHARWSILVKDTPEERREGHIELGELFKVSRGQVTGLNRVWVQHEGAPIVPERFLIPSITDAADIVAAPSNEIRDLDKLRRVVSLPRDLDAITLPERRVVDAFLKWARQLGAHDTYIARHRKPWWHVSLREPAPIVMTYMGRRPPVFALNAAGAKLINVAHGLYPRQGVDEAHARSLVAWLNANVRQSAGRSYAGGLTKFEPSEAMRILVPEHLASA
jgi:hypothetical protein